ncbi:HGxxPAAW family protein [Cellulomonas endophytica]|uniref:HGxxPAAW family protein n=1 Tax=Cellulomonas endophytica TaxID=2494735 RepID=UPI001010256C|nr:HGxxPAAW family protein [Cellulomonas endophytica]
MVDNSLAHRAQNVTRTEAVHLPKAVPPTNHGHTTAAWTTVWFVLGGAVVASVATIFALVWLFWVGMGVIAVGLVLGRVLKSAGFGQGGERTKAKEEAARRAGRSH